MDTHLAVPRLDVPRRLLGLHLGHCLAVVQVVIYLQLAGQLLDLPLAPVHHAVAGTAAVAVVAIPIRGWSLARWLVALAVYAGTPRRTVWRPIGPPPLPGRPLDRIQGRAPLNAARAASRTPRRSVTPGTSPGRG
jgi:hypothetical protein